MLPVALLGEVGVEASMRRIGPKTLPAKPCFFLLIGRDFFMFSFAQNDFRPACLFLLLCLGGHQGRNAKQSPRRWLNKKTFLSTHARQQTHRPTAKKSGASKGAEIKFCKHKQALQTQARSGIILWGARNHRKSKRRAKQAYSTTN